MQIIHIFLFSFFILFNSNECHSTEELFYVLSFSPSRSLPFSPLFFSLSRTLSVSRSLSLSRTHTHTLLFFYFARILSRCLSFACISRASTIRGRACALSRYAFTHARASASTHGSAYLNGRSFARLMFFFSSTASSLKLDFILFYLFIYFIYFFGFLAHFVYLACWPMAVACSLYWPTGSVAWHFFFFVYVLQFFLFSGLLAPALGFFLCFRFSCTHRLLLLSWRRLG